LGIDRPCVLYEYPPSQASLAQVSISSQGIPVAQRFELYIQGMELANGYFELTDADEQTKRFAQDNLERSQLDLPTIPSDEHLIAAMKHGLPACSGVAVGLDRMLMLKVGASSIEDVLSFPITRA
jgi:lysyl-tRNA synthetase class 2